MARRATALRRSLSSLAVRSPRDGKVFASLPDLSADAVDDLVADAAACAGSAWARPNAVASRAASLRALATAIRRDTESLARLESLDCGKPLIEARADMAACADLCDYYAELAPQVLAGSGVPLEVPDADFASRVVPCAAGVVAGVTPWCAASRARPSQPMPGPITGWRARAARAGTTR